MLLFLMGHNQKEILRFYFLCPASRCSIRGTDCVRTLNLWRTEARHLGASGETYFWQLKIFFFFSMGGFICTFSLLISLSITLPTTLDSGIDVAPGINVAPPLKNFHITILTLFYINLGIAVIFDFIFSSKFFKN